MPAHDYYETLGVLRGASKKEVQTAYRRLARKYHPDVTGGDKRAEEAFKRINEAYEVLSDEKKRAAYDRWGDQWMHAEQLEKMQREDAFSGPAGGRPGSVRFEYGGNGGPFQEDDFNDVGGRSIGEVFDRLFRGTGSRGRTSSPRSNVQAGQDLHQTVTITLAEAYTGTTRTVRLQAQELCTACGGEGRIGSVACHACQGTGQRAVGKRLEVKIPAGAETGTRVRLRGKGVPGGGGAPAGDAVLEIRVTDDARFERRGDSLHTEIPVPLTTAVLGGEVEIPTATGKVALRIPEGTQNGRILRLSGKGMPVLRSDRAGDLFAKVRVVLPERLTAEQRALYEQLRAIGDDATPHATAEGASA